jgi:DNA-binding MarR family transcriptional regulator
MARAARRERRTAPARAPARPAAHGPERIATHLFFWIDQAAALYRVELARALRHARLRLAWWRTLSALLSEEGATVSELAAFTLIERTALTRAIDQMERRGLVRRARRASDRRAVGIHLTAEGRQAHARFVPVARAVYDQATLGLDDAGARALLAALKRIRNRLQRRADD